MYPYTEIVPERERERERDISLKKERLARESGKNDCSINVETQNTGINLI